jgi:hypothetical protein
VGQHRTEKNYVLPVADEQGGERLHVDVVEQIGVILDINPHPLDARSKFGPQGV